MASSMADVEIVFNFKSIKTPVPTSQSPDLPVIFRAIQTSGS
jgi:hypothetical protein